jgi:hypothetical protein
VCGRVTLFSVFEDNVSFMNAEDRGGCTDYLSGISVMNRSLGR